MPRAAGARAADAAPARATAGVTVSSASPAFNGGTGTERGIDTDVVALVDAVLALDVFAADSGDLDAKVSRCRTRAGGAAPATPRAAEARAADAASSRTPKGTISSFSRSSPGVGTVTEWGTDTARAVVVGTDFSTA